MLIGILLPFTFAPEYYFSLEGLAKIWDDMLYSFCMSLAISSSVGYVERVLNIRLPWIKRPLQRLLAEFALVTVFAFSASFIVNCLFFAAFGLIDWSDFPWQRMYERSFIPLYVGYVLTAFFVSRDFLFNWREQAVQAEKMRTERYKGEAQILRNQLNPHFLFNSLNVLVNMVYEDADKSADYIRKLSKFYRYVLEVQNEELVQLEQEVKFSKSYLELQQNRFGSDALRSNIGNLGPGLIPPLVIQLLLENAVKHNKIDRETPLTISILQEGEYVSVKNNLQLRTGNVEGTGLGLNNIKERYRFLTDKPVEVCESEHYFEVKLPILKLEYAHANH